MKNFSEKMPDAINSTPPSHFTMVNNDILRLNTLSWKAKGIISTLLSNSKGWTSHESSLINMSTDNITSLRSGLKELEEHGFLMRLSYADKITKRKAGSVWSYTGVAYDHNLYDVFKQLDIRGFEIHGSSMHLIEKLQLEKLQLEKLTVDKLTVEKQHLRILSNKNTEENDKNTEDIRKTNKKNICDFEQNEPISSVLSLGNSSVLKPKVSGRDARKSIQEIVAPEPKAVKPGPYQIILTDFERISKKFYPRTKITPTKLKKWLSDIKGLFEEWSGSVDELHEMLRIYYTNFDKNNTYHVKIMDGPIKNKINKLETFCTKLQTDSKPTIKRYQENFKSDTKGKYDNIKETVINVDED